MSQRLHQVLIYALLAMFSMPKALAGEAANSQPPLPPIENAPKKEVHLIKEEPRLDTFDNAAESSLESTASPPVQLFKLSGGATEKDLAVEWDDWHNKFAQAVRTHMFSNVIETLNMPPGATAWFHCTITSDKHVSKVEITKSSGDFWYDRAIILAVHKLDGNGVLTFPAASKRTEVATDIGIVMGGQDKGYIRFGDTEYREVTPGDGIYVENSEQPNQDNTGNNSNKKKHHKNRSQD